MLNNRLLDEQRKKHAEKSFTVMYQLLIYHSLLLKVEHFQDIIYNIQYKKLKAVNLEETRKPEK